MEFGILLCFCEGWVTDSDIHGPLDSPGGAMCLPAYDGEAVHTGRMSDGLAMFIDGKRVS